LRRLSNEKNLTQSNQLTEDKQFVMIFNKPTAFALAALPAASSSWSIEPSYYSIPKLRLVETASPVDVILRKQRKIAQRMFDQQVTFSSNRYELIDNDEKFQLTVDVPGIKEEDIDIKLDEGQLIVTGQRVAATESSRSTSKFSQSFYLDPTVDVDNFTATLKNGVLVVSAPKETAKIEENVRRIPITPLEDIIAEADKDKEDVAIMDEGEDENVEIPVTSTDDAPPQSK